MANESQSEAHVEPEAGTPTEVPKTETTETEQPDNTEPKKDAGTEQKSEEGSLIQFPEEGAEGEGGGEGEGESKSEEEVKSEGEGEGDKKEEPEQEVELKLPEDSRLNETEVDSIKDFAKKHKLSQETAQELLDSRSKVVNEQVDAFLQQRENWKQEIKEDAEIGKGNFEETSKNVGLFLKRYDKEGVLYDELKKSGNDHHPQIWRVINRAMKEIVGKPVPPGKTDGRTPYQQRTYAEKWYPRKT